MLNTKLLKSKKAYFNYSYEDLEEKTEIPSRRLKAIFNNNCKRVAYLEVIALSKALELSTSDLLEG